MKKSLLFLSIITNCYASSNLNEIKERGELVVAVFDNIMPFSYADGRNLV